jgi:hypothetical protein
MPMLMPPSLLDSCRRELILMLDLLAACIIVQLLADGWMWQVVNQYRDVPLLAILHLMPGRVLLSTILTAGMLFFVIYRMTTIQCLLADRGMFVLGCGAVAGFIAHVLKFVFGRSYPNAEANYGLSSYHPFHSDVGLGSFPSAHAAMGRYRCIIGRHMARSSTAFHFSCFVDRRCSFCRGNSLSERRVAWVRNWL